MIKIAILLLLTMASMCKADTPMPAINSAEQAAACFQKALDTDLKASLPAPAYKFVVDMSKATRLGPFKLQPKDELMEEWRRQTSKDKNQRSIFGAVIKVAESKTTIWYIGYDTGISGGMGIYLDAVSGKILYIQSVPEG